MSECLFHEGEHATAELNLYDSVIDEQIQIPICDKCVEAYDRLREQYTRGKTANE